MVGRNIKPRVFEAFYSLKRLIIVHNDSLSYSGAIDTKLSTRPSTHTRTTSRGLVVLANTMGKKACL